MSFTPGIPMTGQSLGQTRDAVRNNFTNYNNLVSVDHLGPLVANSGQHKQVTLNTFLAGPFGVAGNQSYIFSYDASAAGTQAVYQPSIASVKVPLSPRSLARIKFTGPSTFALDNGPYGPGTNFNVSTPTGLTDASFTYNFASPLATADYFVVVTLENVPTAAWTILNKTVNGFDVRVSLTPSSKFIAILVY